jgi:hypothetical protein
LSDFDSLAKEWEAINNQNNIALDLEIFSSNENKHSIIWKLRYTDKENVIENFSGTYLIELNDKGKCIYFHHSCESI